MFANMRTLVVPKTEVFFYKESERVFFREWLTTIPAKAQRKCLVYLSLLEVHGHELRRPVADLLRDGIYEMRPTLQGLRRSAARHHKGIRCSGS